MNLLGKVRAAGRSALGWQQRYARRIGIVDLVIVVWAVLGAQVFRFGLDNSELRNRYFAVSYVGLTVIFPIVWWIMLAAWGSRDNKILGSGPDEYKRVFAASLWLFGLVAIVSYALKLDVARGYVGIAFPIGVVGLLAGRWILRQHLGLDRAQGRSVSRLLILGGPVAIDHLSEALNRYPQAGYKPDAAYVVGAYDSADNFNNLPVVGAGSDVEGIIAAVGACGADTVAVSSGVQLHPSVMRQLGWELAASNIQMIVAPALTDIAGPRIHTRPVAGLPLIHVSTPKLEGGKRAAKRIFDIVASGILLVIFSPVLLVVAICIKVDSPGPVLFRQQRIGIQGTPFEMLKFRSMVVDAEAKLDALRDQSQGNGVLFKMRNDPRMTRTGAFIRRYSLDELPQLGNVFGGTMSLVGPRPPLSNEVDAYEKHVRRRLLVKPGVTGLWQVSGRSNLSWQDSVRLDLYYVENWSMAGDFIILFKTARAVLQRDGAY